MNYSTAVFLINKGVRAISVSYEPDPGNPDKPLKGQSYTFKSLDPTIQVKDFVIVPTGTRWGMTIGRVEAVDLDVDFDDPTEMKAIIARVNKSDWDRFIQQENDAIQAIRSAEALLNDNPDLRGLSIATSAALSPPAPESV